MIVSEITVTAADVNAFRAAPGNPHMIFDGAVVRIMPQARVERDYPAAFVITTRDDLAMIDPETEWYSAECLAELLTVFADDRYAYTREG